MENRAREMYRVMCIDDQAVWEKFVGDNYSKALIDKPFRGRVVTSVDGKTTRKEESASNLQEKAGLFKQLHQDFHDGKLVSISTQDNTLKMVLKGRDGLTGTFDLKFEADSPYRIDALGVDVNH